ncbi:hypothetical protein HID58_072625 [Brassica napus]|uniref:Uncharacterized protein n=1 Tax=Brassica napus TaxID=3708 RepID=A0ABQ7Z543_BRANA|nr:hypothetical protein HID58_072625 [Brassica napus]
MKVHAKTPSPGRDSSRSTRMCTLISRSTIRSPMIFFFKFRASYDGVS